VPLKAPAGEKYFLVLFGAPAGPAGAEQTDVQARASGDDQTASERSQIEDLQRELSSMREYVQALVLDKEAAFEELRAASEEVQSSNEELQSMNEELETAKEELQSANEELRTVNEELETRNAELSDANGDLRNLLRAVNIPTIIVGRDLRIRRFTPGAERVMNIIATDVGRPITDIALRVDVTDLEELLQQAIENIAVAEREVRDEDGRWYAMQARPYQTETNRIEGAVLTLRDVDEQRRALARSRQAADLSAGMNEVLTALLAGHPLERVMRVVLFEAIATVGASVGVVLMRAGDAWEVRYAQGGSEGIVGRTLADDEVPQATMAETTRAPIAVQSGEGSSQLLPPGYGDSAVVAAPLLADGQVRGVLLFSWQQPEQAPDEAQVDFVNKVGGLVSLALAGE
jgi:PAS domain-containing protein